MCILTTTTNYFFTNYFYLISYIIIITKNKINSNDNDNLDSSGLEPLMETIQAREFDVVDADGRVNRGERFTLLGHGIIRFHQDSCFTSYHIPVK